MILLFCPCIDIFIPQHFNNNQVSSIIWYQSIKLNSKKTLAVVVTAVITSTVVTARAHDPLSLLALILFNGRRIFFHHCCRDSFSIASELDLSQCQRLGTAKTHSHELYYVVAPIHIYPIWVLFTWLHRQLKAPPTMITLHDIDAPSLTPYHILWLRQVQLLLNEIIGSVSSTLVQFFSTSTTSWAT